MSERTIYRLEKVSYRYIGRGLNEPVPALKDISTTIGSGELLVVAGANASGKTTLARLLAGIFLPSGGNMDFAGKPFTRESARPLKGVHMIFQNPENSFVAPTLEEDVAFGLENRRVDPHEIRQRVDDALAMVGLGEYARHHPASLSGGQQQLAALAGSIVCRPDVLIMDEATSYLDDTHRRLVLDIVRRMRETAGPTVILITQEVEEMWLGDHLMVLAGGSLVYEGPPEELLSSPDECRRLRIETDPMAQLASCLRERGFKVPSGRPTPDSLEACLADRG